MDGWNTIVSFWDTPYFQVRTVTVVSGRVQPETNRSPAENWVYSKKKSLLPTIFRGDMLVFRGIRWVVFWVSESYGCFCFLFPIYTIFVIFRWKVGELVFAVDLSSSKREDGFFLSKPPEDRGIFIWPSRRSRWECGVTPDFRGVLMPHIHIDCSIRSLMWLFKHTLPRIIMGI